MLEEAKQQMYDLCQQAPNEEAKNECMANIE